MERLTRYIGSRATSAGDMGNLNFVRSVIDRLAAYEDTGLEPSEVPTGLELANVFAALQELKQYKDAEEQDLLVWLPCRVGDTVYFINYGFDSEICPAIVICAEINLYTPKCPLWLKVEYISQRIGKHEYHSRSDLMLGKTVFLTHEAAKSALAETTDTAKRLEERK